MNRGAILDTVNKKFMKDETPQVDVGDTVDVHYRIIEGTKERIQVFTGDVITRQGSGATEAIVVRRIVANEGVERTFPLHSPKLAKIDIVRRGHTRRARLYYLRDRVGKSRRIPDLRRGLKHYAK